MSNKNPYEPNLTKLYVTGDRNQTDFFEYKEYIDHESGEYKITATLIYKTSSSRAKNKIKKSWEKDKSPMLTALQQMNNEHAREVREGRQRKWYNIEDIEKL